MPAICVRRHASWTPTAGRRSRSTRHRRPGPRSCTASAGCATFAPPNTALARANARALWRTGSRHRRARPLERRLAPGRRGAPAAVLASQSPIILAAPDAAFYRRFMRSLGAAGRLPAARRLDRGLTGEATAARRASRSPKSGLCAEGLAAARKQGSRAAWSRNSTGRSSPTAATSAAIPADLVELLLDLLPLRQAYAARERSGAAASSQRHRSHDPDDPDCSATATARWPCSTAWA